MLFLIVIKSIHVDPPTGQQSHWSDAVFSRLKINMATWLLEGGEVTLECRSPPALPSVLWPAHVNNPPTCPALASDWLPHPAAES